MGTGGIMKEPDYKERYYRVLFLLWILLIVGGCFFVKIHRTLDQLNVNITSHTLQQEIQMYIDAGWVPPYDQTKRMTKDGK
jgi:hypothetical protein